MTIRFRPLFLALGLVLAYSSTIQPMASKAYTGVCALTRWFPLYCVAFDSFVLNNPKYAKPNEAEIKELQQRFLKNKKQLTSAEFPHAHTFFNSIADKRSLSSIVFELRSKQDCIADNNNSEMGTQDLAQILSIREDCAKKVEDILNKKELTHEDQKFLLWMEGIEQHELTHIERNSVMRKTMGQGYACLGSFAVLDVLRRVVSKSMPITSYGPLVGKTLYGLTGIAAISLGTKLQFLYNQYDEYKADDGIPARKDLLEEQAKDYEKTHAWLTEKGRYGSGYNKAIMDRFPTLYHLTTVGESHPPEICRAIRFRNRIKDLEKQAETKS